MNVSNLVAGPELDALVAEKVMGIKLGRCENVELEVVDGGIACPKCLFASIPTRKDLQEHDVVVSRYSTHIAAAWQVEEKIAELRITLPYTDALKHLCKVSENDVPMTFDLVHASPFLRCQAALLAMTYLKWKRS